MQNRYPHLAYWKKRGLSSFPTIPPKVLYQTKIEARIEATRKAFLEQIRKSKNPLMHVFEPHMMDIAESILQDQGVKEAVTDLKEEMDDANRKSSKILNYAKEKIRRGEDRQKVLRELGRETLPKTKGGGTTLGPNRKRMLKSIYLEMQDCIKEIRRRSGVPLKSVPSDGDWDDWSEYIKEYIPEATAIFTNRELPLLTEHPSVANTAAKIILRRLRKYSPHFDISIRRFQAVLSKVSPF